MNTFLSREEVLPSLRGNRSSRPEKDKQSLHENKEYYRQRQQITEHQFGTLKRHWHFDYVLTCGKEKVMGEVYLAFTTYNLRRLMSIFGCDTLISKMRGCLGSFFGQFPDIFIKSSSFQTHLRLISVKNFSFCFLFLNWNYIHKKLMS